MNTEDDLLIDRLRDAWKAPAAGPPLPEHPEPEKIWDAAAGRLAPEVTARLVDHLAICADCAEEWRLALALEREKLDETASGTVAPMPLRPARSTWWDPRWAAAAALLVGALGFAVFLPKAPPPTDDAGYRGVGDPPVPTTPSLEVPDHRGPAGAQIESLVRDNAPVTRKGFKLAWKPVPRAVTYDLSIKTSSLDTVLQVSGLTTTEYQVPAEKLTQLRPASHLIWEVEAVFLDGTRSPRPSTFRLTLEE